MQPDFATLKEAPDQPDFGSLKPSVAPVQPQQSLSSKIWGSLANSSAGQAVTQGGQAVSSAFTQPGVTPLEQGINATGAAAAAVPNVVASAIPGAKSVLGAIGKGYKGLTDFAGNIGNEMGSAVNAIPGVSFNQDKYTKENAQFANSSVGQGVSRAATVGNSLGNVANLILGAKGTASGIQSAVDTTKGLVEKASNSDFANSARSVNRFADQVVPKALDKEVAQIQDTIAPKLDKAGTQAALKEGRLTRAPEGGLRQWAFGKSPDSVVASEETTQAAQTIKDNIPGAAKMDDVQLHGALAGKTEELAQQLQGKMQKVPVPPETVDGITKVWESLKNTQVQEPEFDAYPGSAKAQAKFERFLDPFQQKSFDVSMNQSLGAGPQEPPTLDDIWHARKDYDASVASNVKNATTASAPSLQWQKTMWLQNRTVLNAALNDAKTGLGSESERAFSDMSDMYSAQQNILSKAKLDVKGAPGVAGHVGKSVVKWGATAVLGGLGIKELLH